METNLVMLAKDNLQELFYLKKFKNVEEAIKYGEQITRQYKGYVITYIEEKKTSHRWNIDVFEHIKEDTICSTLIVNSKKSAKLVAERLKEYDDTLRIYINKIY